MNLIQRTKFFILLALNRLINHIHRPNYYNKRAILLETQPIRYIASRKSGEPCAQQNDIQRFLRLPARYATVCG
jgi:hypothetical protein